MQDHDDRPSFGPVEMLEQFEHLELVGEIKISRRFIEEDDVRLLGECHRNPDPLTLTTRQRIDRTVFECHRIRCFECPIDDLVIVFRQASESFLVRETTV